MSSPRFPIQEYFGFAVEVDEAGATATLELDDRHMNPNNVAHGSVAFTMMDTAMGAKVLSMLDEDQLCATIEMQTRFHRGVSSGELTARATVLNAGRRIVHLQAQVTDGDGRLIASATSSFAVLPQPGQKATVVS